jgi:hypothetical protein
MQNCLKFTLEFTDEESEIIKKCDTPEKVQDWLKNEIDYNYEEDKIETLRSFRRVVRDKKAHCLEGALAAAAILSQHGYPPTILCMEATDIDHNVFVYRQNNKIGSVAKSRYQTLLGREAKYKNYRQLVMSYYPYYFNESTQDKTDLTLRGYSLLDLNQFDEDWITPEEDLWFIERHLYRLEYHALFLIDGKRFYYSPTEDGSITFTKPEII